jgi:hypothetical protein
MQPPFTARRQQAVGHQHKQHLVPARAFAAPIQPFCPEPVEPQLPPQFQRQPAGTPLPRPPQPYLRQLQPDNRTVRQQPFAAILRKQRQRARLRRPGFHHLDRAPPCQFLGRVDLAQIQNVALHHPPASNAPVLHHAPAAVLLAILPANLRTQEHDGCPVSAWPRSWE